MSNQVAIESAGALKKAMAASGYSSQASLARAIPDGTQWVPKLVRSRKEPLELPRATLAALNFALSGEVTFVRPGPLSTIQVGDRVIWSNAHASAFRRQRQRTPQRLAEAQLSDKDATAMARGQDTVSAEAYAALAAALPEPFPPATDAELIAHLVRAAALMHGNRVLVSPELLAAVRCWCDASSMARRELERRADVPGLWDKMGRGALQDDAYEALRRALRGLLPKAEPAEPAVKVSAPALKTERTAEWTPEHGQLLTFAREEAGMTINELSSASGLGHAAISMLEAGDRGVVRVSNYDRLRKVLSKRLPAINIPTKAPKQIKLPMHDEDHPLCRLLIRTRCLELKMTRNDVAEKIDISFPTFSAWETNGVASVPTPQRQRLEAFLGIDLSDFVSPDHRVMPVRRKNAMAAVADYEVKVEPYPLSTLMPAFKQGAEVRDAKTVRLPWRAINKGFVIPHDLQNQPPILDHIRQREYLYFEEWTPRKPGGVVLVEIDSGAVYLGVYGGFKRGNLQLLKHGSKAATPLPEARLKRIALLIDSVDAEG